MNGRSTMRFTRLFLSLESAYICARDLFTQSWPKLHSKVIDGNSFDYTTGLLHFRPNRWSSSMKRHFYCDERWWMMNNLISINRIQPLFMVRGIRCVTNLPLTSIRFLLLIQVVTADEATQFEAANADPVGSGKSDKIWSDIVGDLDANFR
jgi:hypothetical protein